MANEKKPASTPSPAKLSPQEAQAARAAAKVANFKRLAQQRVGNAIAKLQGVKQLANRGSYTYDDAQVRKILNALKAEVNAIEIAFTTTTSAAVKPTFEL